MSLSQLQPKLYLLSLNSAPDLPTPKKHESHSFRLWDFNLTHITSYTWMRFFFVSSAYDHSPCCRHIPFVSLNAGTFLYEKGRCFSFTFRIWKIPNPFKVLHLKWGKSGTLTCWGKHNSERVWRCIRSGHLGWRVEQPTVSSVNVCVVHRCADVCVIYLLYYKWVQTFPRGSGWHKGASWYF